MAIKKKVVEIDTQGAQSSIKELRQLLKDLKDVMLTTEKGTELYNKALQEAAEIQHTLKEQMEEVNATAMDFGLIVGNCTKAIGGMVGGFQAITAVMNLFGTENEDIIKTLKTMQQMMAITLALPAIDNGIKAFKRLGIAIKSSTTALKGLSAAAISTGIGILVAALGLLISNWDKVSDAMKRWGIIHEDAKKKMEEEKEKLKQITDELKKAKTAYDDWVKNDQVSRLNKERKAEYEELAKSIEKYKLKIEELGKAEQEASRKGISRESYQKLLDEGNQYLELLRLAETRQRQILEDELSYIETVSKSIILSDDILISWKKKIEERIYKEGKTAKIKIPAVVEIEEIEDKRFLEKADELRHRVENTIEALRNAVITPEEQYEREMHALDLWKNVELNKFKDNEQKKYEILQEYYKLRDALNKEYTGNEIARYSIAANAIGEIFTSLSETLEEGSKEQKALQIMGATINMLAGIAAAIAGAFTTHSGPWDIALAAIQAAAIAASGGATIAKMAKTNKSNATSMASSKPATSALQAINAPVQYTQDVQGASIEDSIRDSKVYVVESDITSTQRKVDVTESERRF